MKSKLKTILKSISICIFILLISFSLVSCGEKPEEDTVDQPTIDIDLSDEKQRPEMPKEKREDWDMRTQLILFFFQPYFWLEFTLLGGFCLLQGSAGQNYFLIVVSFYFSPLFTIYIIIYHIFLQYFLLYFLYFFQIALTVTNHT